MLILLQITSPVQSKSYLIPETKNREPLLTRGPSNANFGFGIYGHAAQGAAPPANR